MRRYGNALRDGKEALALTVLPVADAVAIGRSPVAHLRGLGVTVVDAEPGRLGAALADVAVGKVSGAVGKVTAARPKRAPAGTVMGPPPSDITVSPLLVIRVPSVETSNDPLRVYASTPSRPWTANHALPVVIASRLRPVRCMSGFGNKAGTWYHRAIWQSRSPRRSVLTACAACR